MLFKSSSQFSNNLHESRTAIFIFECANLLRYWKDRSIAHWWRTSISRNIPIFNPMRPEARIIHHSKSWASLHFIGWQYQWRQRNIWITEFGRIGANYVASIYSCVRSLQERFKGSMPNVFRCVFICRDVAMSSILSQPSNLDLGSETDVMYPDWMPRERSIAGACILSA